jgi:undecaprenyl-diphosphatase
MHGLITMSGRMAMELGLAQLAQTTIAPESSPGLIQRSFEALVLGLVQGLTEFLPISSTAHLKVVPVALGWGDPGVAFTAVIQLASIVAILWYFWNDVVQVVRGSLRAIVQKDYQSLDFRMGMGIVLGTIPIVIGGVLIKLFVPDFDNSPLRSMGAIAITSIALAMFLALAEYMGRRKRVLEDLGISDGIWMGLAQAIAIMPGVSRSGSTITAGLFLGMDRAAAARFSFLLGLPAITLAGLVEMKGLLETSLAGTGGIIPIVIGLLSAGLSSYAAIAWLLHYLQTRSMWIFIWYRVGFGMAILGAIAAGLVPNI